MSIELRLEAFVIVEVYFQFERHQLIHLQTPKYKFAYFVYRPENTQCEVKFYLTYWSRVGRMQKNVVNFYATKLR